MAVPTIIVFGPTGQVGSSAALFAQERGAKVVLAMRDPSKTIPGLSAEKEKTGGFQRVQADLTKPDTIKDAVSKTGATRAFIYLTFGATDGMRPAIEALKAAGIEFVVFLSSSSVTGKIREVTPAEYIPFAHAQVEISLDEVFGPSGYIALRPAFFTTNVAWWKSGWLAGDLRIFRPDAKFDWISPEDIGRAGGNVLVKGIQATEGAEERNFIYLAGPKLISQRDAAGIFSKVFGKDVKVTGVDTDEALKVYTENGMPEMVAKQLLKNYEEVADGKGQMYEPKAYAASVANLKKYAERATSLEEWAEANKGFFDP